MSEAKKSVEDFYWDYVLTHEKPPVSVYQLCKDSDWGEADFYRKYASLQALENAFWATTITETISAIKADTAYAEYNTRQQLLAFYYTYFEHILQYRSRFLARFPGECSPKCLLRLKKMQAAFLEYAEELSLGMKRGIEGNAMTAQLGALLEPLEKRGAWVQFMFVLQFHLKDESSEFEDTDALIEKSVNLAFDLQETQLLGSALDLAKFLVAKHGL